MGDETVPESGTGDDGSTRRATKLAPETGTGDDGSKRRATKLSHKWARTTTGDKRDLLMGMGDRKGGSKRQAPVFGSEFGLKDGRPNCPGNGKGRRWVKTTID